MKIHGSRKQRGVIAPLVVITLPVLLLAMGWALDFGHVFVNKTRLQNALDATALSAAITINYDPNKDYAAAEAKARDTFNKFIAAPGNNELLNLDAGSLVFDYSKTLYPSWVSIKPTSADPFVFVKVTSTNMLNVTPVLIRISNLFTNNIPVPAISTAGPVGNNCQLMPFLLCADMGPPLDTDCSDGACYGYNVNQIYPLIQKDCKNDPLCQLTAGNYGLLNLAGQQGGNDIKLALEGKTFNACPFNYQLPLNTKPGITWGDVRAGVNYRIDTLDTNDNDYFTSTAYADYIAAGGNNSRLIAVPIGDCTQMEKSGTTTLPQIGTACIFLAQHAPNGNPKDVPAQFIKSCEVTGVWNPNNAVLNGPYKIVLFKSPGSGDS